MDLQYVRIDGAGISAAKNVGIFAARAPLLFSFDDDDIASPALLARHLETHVANPAEHVAVLGYTTWAPSLKVTPLMHYVTDVGGFLFCYGPIRHGEWLDFTYFWGGWTSCKRALLTRHSVGH
jgi:glycosyltransferase involved in cell wall biosynthesis